MTAIPDPNAGNPVCETSATVEWHNFTLGAPPAPYRAINIVMLAVLYPASVAMFACFAVLRHRYDRTRVRPMMVPRLALMGVTAFVVCDTIPKVYGFYAYPCVVTSVSGLLVVPCLGLTILYQLTFLLLMTRFAAASARAFGQGGRLKDMAEQERAPRGCCETAAFEMRAVVDAALIAVRKLPSSSAAVASGSEAAAGSGAGDAGDMSREEQLQSLLTLQFVLSERGQSLYALFTLAPFLIVALAVGVAGDPAYYSGCRGCPVSGTVTYVLLVEAVLIILGGLLLRFRTQRIRRDPWNFKRENALTLACAVVSLLGFVLYNFTDLSEVAPTFDASIIALAGLVGMLFASTVFPVLMAHRVEPRGDHPQRQAAVRAAPNSPGGGKSAVRGGGGGGRSGGTASAAGTSAAGAAAASYHGNGQSAAYSEPDDYRFEHLDDILRSPALLDAFTRYLQTEFGAEALMFLQDTAQWRAQYNDVSASARSARARRIARTYVGAHAMLAINVPATVERAILAQLAKAEDAVPLSVFDAARDEIARLLELGAMRRFKERSAEYLEVAAGGAGGGRARDDDDDDGQGGADVSRVLQVVHGGP